MRPPRSPRTLRHDALVQAHRRRDCGAGPPRRLRRRRSRHAAATSSGHRRHAVVVHQSDFQDRFCEHHHHRRIGCRCRHPHRRRNAHPGTLPRDGQDEPAGQRCGWKQLRDRLRDAPARCMERALLLPGQWGYRRQRRHRDRSGQRRRRLDQRAQHGLRRDQFRRGPRRLARAGLRHRPASAARLWLPGRGHTHPDGQERDRHRLWQGPRSLLLRRLLQRWASHLHRRGAHARRVRRLPRRRTRLPLAAGRHRQHLRRAAVRVGSHHPRRYFDRFHHR